MSCSSSEKKKVTPKAAITTTKKVKKAKKKSVLLEDPKIVLDEKNAIPFLFEYQKQDPRPGKNQHTLW